MFCQFFFKREARKLEASCTFSAISSLLIFTCPMATDMHIT
jgi:hypothetical protein